LKKGGGGGAHFHEHDEFAEMLNHMFGGGAGRFPGAGFGMGGGRSRASEDAIQEFEVSLEDLYKGKQVKMMSKRKVICSSCKGYLSRR
jgi:DnaJ homolog subfamily A member 2